MPSNSSIAVAVKRAIEVCKRSARMIEYEYRYSPVVHFLGPNGTTHALRSETGVKQGHGFGSVIFAAGKQPVYERMRDADSEADGGEIAVIGFLDDAHIIGGDAARNSALAEWYEGIRG